MNRADPTDLRVTRGTTRTFDIAAKRYNPDGSELGPLNLTGATIRFMAKRRYEDDDSKAVLDYAIGSGITVTNAAGGLATLKISAADTLDADPGKVTKLVYSLEAIEVSGDVNEIAWGEVVIDPKARST